MLAPLLNHVSKEAGLQEAYTKKGGLGQGRFIDGVAVRGSERSVGLQGWLEQEVKKKRPHPRTLTGELRGSGAGAP